MAKLDVKITVETPLHLGSGQADVNIDAEIVHDAFGLPYFPAKRFKGLLYESAVEVFEMFKLAGMSTENLAALENVFHRNSDDGGKVSEVQIIVPNFYLKNYEKLCEDWKYLQSKYKEIFRPADVLKNFTSIRYQTKIENGIAANKSLHNLNVLDAGTEFFGTIEILNSNDKVLNLMALAMKNLKSAGTKRNRGFGRISCTANFGIDIEKFLAKEA
jgi:CRISPR/Cas system CSM-associated protein Csm3 (group 7 of RAMP superfamily)